MSYIILFFFIKGSDSIAILIYLTFFNFKIFNFEILSVALLVIQIVWLECCFTQRVA